MTGRLFFTGFSLAMIFQFSSCSSSADPADFSADKLKNTPLFHFTQISAIDESPLNTPEFLNRKALKLLGIQKVLIYSKGGKNPEDTLEKISFVYSDNWESMKYALERFDESPVTWTKGSITFDEKSNGSATFDRYFGINKQAHTEFITTDNQFLVVKAKPNNRFDTTYYYGTFEDHKAVVERIGDHVLSVDIFLPAGSSSKDVKKAFTRLQLPPGSINFAQCSVTFMEKEKPVECYLLNDQFSQVNLLKDWKYDDLGRLTEFNEWNGTNQLKTILVHYAGGAVPDYFSINQKTYYVLYN